MQNHDWYDERIESVEDFGEEKREIILRSCDSDLTITREDVIALAKDFGLIIYERDTSL